MITEHLMRPGSGSIKFRRTLPRSISKQITDLIEGVGCHVVITPVRLNPSDFTDSIVLGAAMYTGVVLARPSRTELAVTGLGWWLDSVNETPIARTSGTPSQWLGDLLINGLTTGTVSGGSNVTRTFLAHAQTRREALDTVATLGSWEYDIRPNFTVNAGNPSNLFQSPPSVVVTNRAEGPDGPYRGLAAGLLSQSIDASQTATKAVVLGQGQGSAVPLGTATQSVPLKTYTGGTPTIVKAIDAPTEAQAQLAASASATLAASRVVQNVRVATPAMGPGSGPATSTSRSFTTTRGAGGMFSTGRGAGATVGARPVRLPTPPPPPDPAIAERAGLLAQAQTAMNNARALSTTAARGFLGLRRTSGGRSTGTDSDLTRRLLRPGDEVYLYDVESGLYDTANEIIYRGETTSPVLVRVLSITWPVSPRFGVYIRSNAASPTIIDISSYVEPETGGAFIDVGARAASSYSTGSRSNPALEQRLAGSGFTTYAPTLNGIAIGTGGVNSAEWSYDGEVLEVRGTITLGTGFGAPGALVTATLPAGFSATGTFMSRLVGDCIYDQAGSGFPGVLRLQSASAVRFLVQNVAATYPTLSQISSTIPFLWNTGNSILWRATIPGEFL